MRIRLAAILAILVSSAGCSPVIDEVDVTENPANVLSAFVRWQTDEPGTSRVEFGEGELEFFVEDGEAVTDHEVLVIGMHAQTDYRMRAVTVFEDGARAESEEWTHTTGALPFADLHTEVLVRDDDRIQPGWTLANAALYEVVSPVRAVMLDAGGEVVWYYEMDDRDGRADIEVSLADGDHVVIGGGVPPFGHAQEVDLAGDVLWEGPEQVNVNEFLTDGEQHHRFGKLDSGNYMFMRYAVAESGEGYDLLEEMTPDHEIVWSWSGLDHVVADYDIYTWGNGVIVDEPDDVVYFNTRNVSQFFKLRRSTGEVLWRFGEGGDFEMLTQAEHPWPSHAHAPSWTPEGNLLLYDNGDLSREFSRIVEYALDEDAMTAELVWEYPGDGVDDEWFNFAMGDADRLANGNTLAVAPALIQSNSQSRIIEVTADGEKVWDLRLSAGDEGLACAYMAERIPELVGRL